MAQKGSTHRNNIRVGLETGLSATRTVGSVVLHQRAEAISAPISGSQVFVLPTSSEVHRFDVVVASAMGAEATVRFGAVGATGSNLYGQVTISAAGNYSINNPATVPSVWAVGASSQPIAISIVAGSGAVTPANGNINAKIFYTRKYQRFDV